jgi:hypothetical protein
MTKQQSENFYLQMTNIQIRAKKELILQQQVNMVTNDLHSWFYADSLIL